MKASEFLVLLNKEEDRTLSHSTYNLHHIDYPQEQQVF